MQNKKSIILLNCRVSGNISEQSFPDKYGQITSFEWVDHFLVIGFSQGNVIVVETGPNGNKVRVLVFLFLPSFRRKWD